jgi:hypothetical protein
MRPYIAAGTILSSFVLGFASAFMPFQDNMRIYYRQSCEPCHKTGKEITGPSLAFISSRRDKKWLYAYTRNNIKVQSSGDRFANCLYQQYKTPMPVFPNLSDGQLDALYDYIDKESRRLGLKAPDDHLKKCVDSCKRCDCHCGT